MRRTRTPLLALVAVLVAGAAAAPSASAAPAVPTTRPASWTVVPTPPMSGDTSQKVLKQVDVLPDGSVFSTGWTRHDLPGVSEVRTLVERWDGSSWQTMSTPDVETAPAADYLWGVSGTSATDVWAVGRSATAPGRPAAIPLALHYDGAAWTKVAVPDPSGGFGADMTAVAAISPTDVWAVGTAYPLEAMGAAYHWDGTAWSSFRLPLLPGCLGSNFTQLMAIAATPSGDVYAGGDCPTRSGRAGFVIAMVSLGQWKVVTRVPGTSSITDMTSAADGTVWATGTRSATSSRPFLLSGSGTTWSTRYRPVTTDGSYEQSVAVAVTSRGITMMGERDTRQGQRSPWGVTWLGNRWQPIDLPAPASTSWLTAVDGSETGPVWGLGQYLGDRARMTGFGAQPG